jgi:transcriptional regulator with XRE-family HTH domain
MRIAPESQFLGERVRLPSRVGKRVTQEEVAEYLGISRGWYARFEAGSPSGFSLPLLSRLGDLLLLTASERAELLRLARPELAPVVPRASTAVCEALGAVRRAVKRLWSASSEDEILNIAGEEARQLVPCFDLIFARRSEAPHEAQFPKPGWNLAARYAEARAFALRRFTPQQRARREAVWQRAPAGGVLSIDAYPPDVLRVFRGALHEHGMAAYSPVSVHMRGSSGSALVGGTSMRPHDVTKLERSMLSTIADITSLVLR